MILVQSLASLIIAYSLLGVFYMRFSRPARRAQTLIFSRYMVMHEEDGVPIIAFRIANIRKHQIIEANVRLLVAFNNTLTDEDESMFNFTSLPQQQQQHFFSYT
jgi:inward rectifier potassium channel